MVTLKCKKCNQEINFREGIQANIVCQSCNHFEFTTHNQIKLVCAKCGSVTEKEAGQVFDSRHSCGSIYAINPDVEEPPAFEPAPNDTVSVVVVCHNQLAITQECIKRLKKTSAREIILVDNNSTDKTEDWARAEDFIYIRNQMNLGCGIARNQGAKRATGKYILFLDNDQYVNETFVDRIQQVNGDLVGIEQWAIDHQGTPRPVTGPFGTNHYIGAGGMLVKRHVFLALGGFDEIFSPAWFEDVDFSFRARQKGYAIGVLRDADVEHLEHKTIHAQKDFDEKAVKLKSREVFMERWGTYLLNHDRQPAQEQVSKRASYTKKPKIYIAVDCENWAWDHKTQQIVKHLSDDFDFTVQYATKGLKPVVSDLYFTYEINWVNRLTGVPHKKILTGVTAHVYKNMQDWKATLEGVKAIHANSMLLFDEVKDLNRCFYVPNGVDQDLFDYQPKDLSEPFAVGYVGKDNATKGLKMIKDACKYAGVELRAMTAKVSSKHRVDHAKMPEFYEHIDAVVIASTTDGTPNMLLEAAAVGRTFIGNRIGNVPEFYNGRNGIVVERDILKYKEALEELKTNRTRCADMGVEARRSVEIEWNWQHQAENYRKMFWESL